MNKRGMSPFIISIILIGVVIVFAVIFNLWVSGVFDTAKNQQFSNFRYFDFEINYINDLTKCIGSENRCFSEGSDFYCLVIYNEENLDVEYVIKTVGTEGISVVNDCDTLLTAYESKIFRIDYDSNVIGKLDYAEVLPYTS